MRRFLIWLAVAATAATLAPDFALAGEPEIEVDAAVPFSAAELRSAVVLRTAEDLPSIRVSPAPDAGAVVVTVGGARRTVALGSLSGIAAARRVAVVSLDLFATSATPAPTAAERTPVDELRGPALPREPVATDTVFLDQPRPDRHPRAAIDVAGMYGLGGRGASIDASFGLRGPLRGLVTAALSVDDADDELRATCLPIGAGLGWRWQQRWLAVEGHGQLLVAPHWISVADGGSRLSHSEVRFGVGALTSVALHVTGPLWASLTGRLGGYLSRQRYLVGGREVYANGHLDASIGVGVSVAAGGMR